MSWRTYNERNICARTGIIFATYFRTKKEAVAYCEIYGGVVEKKLVTSWQKVAEINNGKSRPEAYSY